VKTSSKLTVAVLTTLVVGGTSAGSMFSSVLNEGSSNSIGTAGAIFSTLDLPETSATVAPVLEDLPETSATVATVSEPVTDQSDVVVAEAKPAKSPSLASKEPGTKIRTVTQQPELVVLPETSPTPDVIAIPEPTETPVLDSSATPELQVEPTSIPTPEPTSSLMSEEPSSIEP
jgi:apolipoprotein N-acyltransferase